MEKWSFQRIRELMTRIALRGMAANELGRARISMMVRSMSSNTRPDTLVQDPTLQPHDFSCNARRVHTLGSSRGCSRFHFVRALRTSSRSCSVACRLFFESNVVTVEEAPDGTAAHRNSACTQPAANFFQRQVGFFRDQPQ